MYFLPSYEYVRRNGKVQGVTTSHKFSFRKNITRSLLDILTPFNLNPTGMFMLAHSNRKMRKSAQTW